MTTWECRLTEFLLRFKFQDGDGGGSGPIYSLRIVLGGWVKKMKKLNWSALDFLRRSDRRDSQKSNKTNHSQLVSSNRWSSESGLHMASTVTGGSVGDLQQEKALRRSRSSRLSFCELLGNAGRNGGGGVVGGLPAVDGVVGQFGSADGGRAGILDFFKRKFTGNFRMATGERGRLKLAGKRHSLSLSIASVAVVEEVAPAATLLVCEHPGRTIVSGQTCRLCPLSAVSPRTSSRASSGGLSLLSETNCNSEEQEKEAAEETVEDPCIVYYIFYIS